MVKRLGEKGIQYTGDTNDFVIFAVNNSHNRAVFLLYDEQYWILAEHTNDFVRILTPIQLSALGMIWLRHCVIAFEPAAAKLNV